MLLKAGVGLPRRPVFYGWVIVPVLGVGMIVSQGATLYLFSLLLVPMQRELGWSRAELSGGYSLGSLVLGVAGLGVGRLVDRHGPRGVMIAGCALAAACLAAVGASHQVWQFYLFWGLGLGVAGSLTSLQVGSTTVANWFSRRRGTALALLTTMVGLCAPIYVPAASWLIVHAGWRQAVTVLGIAFLLIPMPLSLLLRRRPEDAGLRPDGDPPSPDGDPPSPDGDPPSPGGDPRSPGVEAPPEVGGASFGESMRHPAFWTLTLTTVLSATALGAVSAHQVAHMIGRGISPVLAASVVGTLGLLSIPGRFFFNAAGDWFGTRRLLVAVIAIQAVGIGILTLATSAAWLFVYAAIYGIAAGSAFGLRAALMADMFGRRAFGAISAVYQLFIYSGAAVGPIAAGLMFDHFHDYDLAFTLAALLTAVSIVGLLLIPRTRLELERESRRAARAGPGA